MIVSEHEGQCKEQKFSGCNYRSFASHTPIRYFATDYKFLYKFAIFS